MKSDKSRFTLKKRRLNYLIALCTGTAALATGGPSIFAQELEEITVTGSRIMRDTNATSSQPLSTIDAEQLNNTSTTDVADILNDNPALLSSVTSTSSIDNGAENLATDNVGGSTLDLRGLGYERTLTLVNGRRHVSGVEGTTAVDVSTIPSALIERVEVLTGGASAIYGADAVTGVVNFVLKDDYEGAEMDFRTSMSEQGDAETATLSGLFGKNFDNGNITVAAQWSSNAGLRQGDRAHTANDGLWADDVNPALRFQIGDIDASSTPNFSQYYNFDNTGLFPVGLRIPDADTFIADYTDAFGAAPSLTDAELALIDQAANAPARVLMPGRTFNITSPYGVVAIGDFGTGEYPLGAEPDLDGNGTPDCLDSFTGYNSSLGGAASFGALGGCWYLDENGSPIPYKDGLVAGNFNHFGAEQSFVAPNRPYTIPKEDKYSLNLNGRYDLDVNHSLFVESKYVYHEVEFGGSGHNYTDMLYGAPDNPFLPPELAAYANNSGISWLGPGGLRISRDSDDWGDNISTNERETWRVVAGFEGTIPGLGFDYEVSGNYGRFERKLIDREAMVADRFFAAIDVVTDPATGEPVCRSDLDPTAYPETTPFDIFPFVGGGVRGSFFTFTPGDGSCKPADIWSGRGAVSQEAVDFMTYTRTIEEEMEQKVVTGFISGDSSQWFALPAGPVGFVFGGEWREESTTQNFDSYDQGILPVSGVTSEGIPFSAGDWVGDVSGASSIGSEPASRLLNGDSKYDVLDIFAEIEVPVLAGRPFAEELSLNAAVRSADYSTFGENTTYKVGAVWSPHPDLRTRVTYSEAVRVPNLYELYSPEQGSFFRPQDPCDVSQISSAPNAALRQANCVAALQAINVPNENILDAQGNYIFVDPLSAGFPGVVGGNSDLEPEEATTRTIGFVYQPLFLDGFTVSVDFWDIEIEGAIKEISAQNIVNGCYDGPSINSPFCALIERNAEPTSAQAGGFTFLRQTLLNFGSAEAQGIDTNVSYSFSIGEYLVGLGAGVTKQNKLNFIEPAAPGEPAQVDVELGEMRRPEWAGQLNATVSWGALTVLLNSSYLSKQTLDYESGVEIETVDANYGPAGYTDDFLTHNLSGRYEFSPELLFYGGINNVTDEEPFATERGYPVSVVGRAYYLGLNYVF